MLAKTVDGAYINAAHVVELVPPIEQNIVQDEDGSDYLHLTFRVGGYQYGFSQEDVSQSYMLAVLSNEHRHLITEAVAASIISQAFPSTA